MPRSLIKSCLSCNEKKLKCDAARVGLPCSRCKSKGSSQQSNCIRVFRRERRSTRPRSHTLNAETGLAISQPSPRSDVHEASSFLDSTGVHSTQRPSSTTETTPCQNSQVLVRECEEIAAGTRLPAPEKMLSTLGCGRDVVQYHSESHYVTIMGEIFSKERTSKITRIIVDDGNKPPQEACHVQPDVQGSCSTSHAQLDPVEKEFLARKSAFDLPLKDSFDSLLRAYFAVAYQSTPVFDQVEFMRSCANGTCSLFLAQAVLANASLYVAQDVIRACGFVDRAEALEAFYTRATLLYDFGCETSQLRLLQGSIVLAMTGFTGRSDKDFGFWYHNALRLAFKMGIHQNFNSYDMDTSTHQLYQRIWWVLYNRDVLLALTGLENKRMLEADNGNSTTPPTIEDWVVENTSASYNHVLSPSQEREKLYFIENCRLAVIDLCLSAVKSGSSSSLNFVEEEFNSWLTSLPTPLLPSLGQDAKDGVWYMVLTGTSYRFQLILLRMIWKRWKASDAELSKKSIERLRLVMYELDALIGRAMALDMVKDLPMVFLTCIPVVLTFHFELVLKSSESELVKSRSHVYIQQSIIFLKQRQDIPRIKKALDLAEWVLTKIDLPSNCNLDRPRVPTDRSHDTSSFEVNVPLLYENSVETDGVDNFWEFCFNDSSIFSEFLAQ